MLLQLFNFFFRVTFREKCNSFPVLISLLDCVLFPSTSPEVTLSHDSHVTQDSSGNTGQTCVMSEENGVSESEYGQKEDGMKVPEEDETLSSQVPNDEQVKSKITSDCFQFPERDTSFILPEAMTEKRCVVVSEILKIIFNQTVHWKEDADFDEVRKKLIGCNVIVRTVNTRITVR